MRYTPFASDIEFPFYTALASLKINHDKLDDAARKVLGFYEVRPADPPNTSCRMQIHGSALTSDETPTGFYRAEGMIKNVNTFEEYINIDKAHVLHQSAKMIWDAICDGTIYSSPSLLSSFIILSYADLKKYKFHYWFAFPALHSNPSWSLLEETEGDDRPGQSRKAKTSAGGLSDAEIALLVETVKTWSYGVEDRQRGFFLARRVHDIKNGTGHENRSGITDQVTELSNHDDPRWRIAPLSAYENGFFNEASFEDCYVCFADPSNYDDAPGWVLRNLLVLVKLRWGLNKIQVLRYRDTQPQPSRGNYKSAVLILGSDDMHTPSAANSQSPSEDMPKVTGWERNPAGKLTGRFVNLTEYLDPKRLADQSVDLNLKLMKWRISPNLNLERIKHTKCLLLGAGTLGSYVARNLMGWGVSRITFVDNGSVSFSNPVRQPLYNFADCIDGGVKKALRASQALLEIYPGVDSTGHVLSVPMLGHPVIDVEKARAEFEVLQTLIDEHDVIFLLMDTREARWLPTVMGKAAGKIVMNAALGFDSYVVMRHGIKIDGNPSTELGCYFCNDVVAPMNSVKDQTLDQQCTVTRPGVAAIASALLVELLVSLLQHPLGAAAPAPSSRSDDRGNHPLGLVPHQIRGFLATFENVPVIGRSYKYCSACSDNITLTYKEDGWKFVLRALNEPGYVEELSGLKEVRLSLVHFPQSHDIRTSASSSTPHLSISFCFSPVI
ncbi:E1-like protein-activating [Aspergillus sclerotiicarbonarius CBS 121057]|uniref:Ubiquitin-like modifier-activating enzyme ATG7 n=1 Tax=Aspergillus sclerotiicarbonarius (strain CBS 121057 / IBT 28362) TaxID=1448318 RepID=A0A319DS12_ASPSB|nr:E1-like protein-activating [Aspergillus sclerotiicarbonarius CBS 121057]